MSPMGPGSELEAVEHTPLSLEAIGESQCASRQTARGEELNALDPSLTQFDVLRVHRSGLFIPGREKDLDPLDVVASGFQWWQQPVRGGTVL